jgi:hypothetical protein
MTNWKPGDVLLYGPSQFSGRTSICVVTRVEGSRLWGYWRFSDDGRWGDHEEMCGWFDEPIQHPDADAIRLELVRRELAKAGGVEFDG